MFQEVADLQEEGQTLDGVLQTLQPQDWARPTPFKQWTVWDVVAHLYLSDQWAVAALKGADAFRSAAAPVLGALDRGIALTDFTREHLQHLAGATMRQAWSDSFDDLGRRLSVLHPKARLAWFGPDMGARMFVTARYMETWAHGQDIYDLLGRRRRYTDGIRAIATLGVKTYAFCFANRGLTPPAPAPYLRLTAPSGAIWEWNPPSDEHRIEGSASDFCHVVTQGRNVADTLLQVIGDPARRWMAIAQCFAGKAEDPPVPGLRGGSASIASHKRPD